MLKSFPHERLLLDETNDFSPIENINMRPKLSPLIQKLKEIELCVSNFSCQENQRALPIRIAILGQQLASLT